MNGYYKKLFALGILCLASAISISVATNPPRPRVINIPREETYTEKWVAGLKNKVKTTRETLFDRGDVYNKAFFYLLKEEIIPFMGRNYLKLNPQTQKYLLDTIGNAIPNLTHRFLRQDFPDSSRQLKEDIDWLQKDLIRLNDQRQKQADAEENKEPIKTMKDEIIAIEINRSGWYVTAAKRNEDVLKRKKALQEKLLVPRLTLDNASLDTVRFVYPAITILYLNVLISLSSAFDKLQELYGVRYGPLTQVQHEASKLLEQARAIEKDADDREERLRQSSLPGYIGEALINERKGIIEDLRQKAKGLREQAKRMLMNPEQK